MFPDHISGRSHIRVVVLRLVTATRAADHVRKGPRSRLVPAVIRLTFSGLSPGGSCEPKEA